MIALLFISLLAILAGALLLAKNKKEQLGSIFCYISWFFIAVGLLLFIYFVVGEICHLTHGGKIGQPCCSKELIMKDCKQGLSAGTCSPYGAGACMHKDKCMQHGDCCVMHHGCMQHMCCMKHDSTMKACPGHFPGDSTKMSDTKEKSEEEHE